MALCTPTPARRVWQGGRDGPSTAAPSLPAPAPGRTTVHTATHVIKAQGLGCGLHVPIICTQIHRTQVPKKRLLKLPKEDVGNNHPAPQGSAFRHGEELALSLMLG